MNKQKSTEETLDDMVDQYFPKDKRHARGQAVLMKESLLALIESEKAKAAKCSGCGKDSSYCANCERLLQT